MTAAYRAVLSAMIFGLLISNVSMATADEMDRFLKFGRTLDAQSRPLNETEAMMYQRSIQKIKDVSNCTLPVEHGTAEAGAIDWSSIGSIFDFEVCIFRVARHYQSAAQLEKWIKVHLTQGVSILERPDVLMRIMGSTGTGVLLSFDIETRNFRTGAFGILRRMLSGVVSVGVTLDADGLPRNVQVVTIYK